MVMQDKSSLIVPKLRENLKLLESQPADDGSKQWMIFDSIQNRYFTIGIDAFEIIMHWQDGISYQEFVDILIANDYHIDIDSLDTFIQFLKNNNLIKVYTQEDTKKLLAQKKSKKQSFFKSIIHNYLFIKIPLFKPDRWLESTYPKIEFLYSTLWQYIIFALGIIGIFVVIQRFEEFSSTFMYLFSKEGMIYYILSLIFVKVVHELAHAYTTKRYGAQVPSMGVAFLVMFPVLYTDTTNAYAIRSKHKRLKIVLAGMKAEIYLALIATFLWGFLPNGSLKSIAFIVATTSWITSLLVNISPFLRFDGYYALSDWTNTTNLQPRSFAMAKWFIRYYILGVDTNKPELITKSKERFFISYAIATWIYRFFLFLGIAVLVYYFAFKLLGIVLFLVEIVWFILLPLYKELQAWWQLRSDVRINRRNTLSATIFVSIITLLVIPWSSTVSMSAILVAKENRQIYAPKASQIVSIQIKDKEHVQKNQILLKLSSKKLEYEIEKSIYEIELLKNQLDKIASNDQFLNSQYVLQVSLIKKENELKALKESQKELIIKAPHDGVILYNEHIQIDQYINTKEPIFTIYNPNSFVVEGFCDVKDIEYIKPNSNGLFIADSGMDSIKTKIDQISDITITHQRYPSLTSIYGGDIAVREDSDKRLISEDSYVKIDSSIVSNISKDIGYRVSGKVIIESKNNSIASRFYTILYNIFIKESSF
jgi:putative peptide zinc metalloprotease protein